MKKSTYLPIGLLAIALVIFGLPRLLAKGNPTPPENLAPEQTVTPSPAISQDANPVESHGREINLEAGSFYYKPDVITVKKGERIFLTLNAVSMMHDFNVDELGIKVAITKSGESNSVEFTANQVGTFEYYCSVGQHRKMGQVGKLIVTD